MLYRKHKSTRIETSQLKYSILLYSSAWICQSSTSLGSVAVYIFHYSADLTKSFHFCQNIIKLQFIYSLMIIFLINWHVISHSFSINYLLGVISKASLEQKDIFRGNIFGNEIHLTLQWRTDEGHSSLVP